MESIKKKLKQFEKALSVKYLARDIILLQVCILIGSLIAAIAFLCLVSYASTQSDPVAVMQNTHDTTSGIGFWIFYLVTNVLVFYVGNKYKNQATRTKEEIIDMVEPMEKEE